MKGSVGCRKGRGNDCVRMVICIKVSVFAHGQLLWASATPMICVARVPLGQIPLLMMSHHYLQLDMFGER